MKTKSILIKKTIAVIFIISLIIGCQQEAEIIKFDNAKINYTGRVNLTTDSAAIVYWPGTSIKINFEGTGLSALMNDENGQNYYNIILDKDSIILFRPGSEKNWYSLISGIPTGKHKLEIFRRTEWDRGKTYFYAFEAEKGSHFTETSPISDRSIEFFGNSRFCRYQVLLLWTRFSFCIAGWA